MMLLEPLCQSTGVDEQGEKLANTQLKLGSCQQRLDPQSYSTSISKGMPTPGSFIGLHILFLWRMIFPHKVVLPLGKWSSLKAGLILLGEGAGGGVRGSQLYVHP